MLTKIFKFLSKINNIKFYYKMDLDDEISQESQKEYDPC